MSIRYAAPKDCVSSIKVKTSPEGRYGHRSVLFEDKVYFFGGYNGSRRLNDIHEFDTFTQKWRKIKCKAHTLPRPRDCHSCVLYKDNIVVFGGGTGYQWMHDLFFFHIPTRRWYKKIQTGEVPQGRAGHSAVVYEDEMYIFGGWNGFTTLNDLYCLNLKTFEWKHVGGKGTVPERRDSHCAILVENEMVIIGGGDGHKRLNDMYTFNMDTKIWGKIRYEGSEEERRSAKKKKKKRQQRRRRGGRDNGGEASLGIGLVGRAGHFVTSYPSGPSLMMYGGGDGSSWIRNVFRFDIEKKRWEVIDVSKCSVKIPGCYGCSGAIHRNKMYLFGGGDGANFYNELFIITLDVENERKTIRQLNKTRKSNNLSDMLIVCADDDDSNINEEEEEDLNRLNSHKFGCFDDDEERRFSNDSTSFMQVMSSSDESSGLNSSSNNGSFY